MVENKMVELLLLISVYSTGFPKMNYARFINAISASRKPSPIRKLSKCMKCKARSRLSRLPQYSTVVLILKRFSGRIGKVGSVWRGF